MGDKSSWGDLGVVTCTRCNFKTSDHKLLQVHICRLKSKKSNSGITAGISYNLDNKKFSCSLCNVDLPEKEFKEHFEKHLSQPPYYYCKYCGVGFDTRRDVLQHRSEIHPDFHNEFHLKLTSKSKDLMTQAKNKGKVFYEPQNTNVISPESPVVTTPAKNATPSGKGGKSILHNSSATPVSANILATNQPSVTYFQPGPQLLTNNITPIAQPQIVNLPTVVQRPALHSQQAVHGTQPYYVLNVAVPVASVQNTRPNAAFISPSPIGVQSVNSVPVQNLQSQVPATFMPLHSLVTTPRMPPQSNFHTVPSLRVAASLSSSPSLNILSQTLGNINSTLSIPVTLNQAASSNSSQASNSSVISQANTAVSSSAGSVIVSTESTSVLRENTNVSASHGGMGNPEYIVSIQDEPSICEDIKSEVSPISASSKSSDVTQGALSSSAPSSSTETPTSCNTSDNANQNESSQIQRSRPLVVIRKGFFICMSCSFKYRDHDKFFRHFWEHVHNNTNISCCPGGYNVGCTEFKEAVRKVYKDNSVCMTEEITNYLQPETANVDQVGEEVSVPEVSEHVTIQNVPVEESSETVSGVQTEEIPVDEENTGTDDNRRNVSEDISLGNGEADTLIDNGDGSHHQDTSDKALRNLDIDIEVSLTHALNPSSKDNSQTVTSVDEHQRDFQSDSLTDGENNNSEESEQLPAEQKQTHEVSENQNNYFPIIEDISEDEESRSGGVDNNVLIAQSSSTAENFNSGETEVQADESQNPETHIVNSSHPPSKQSVDFVGRPAPVSRLVERIDRNSSDSSGMSDEGESRMRSFYQCGFKNCVYTSHQPIDLLLHNEESHGCENEFPCIYCGYQGSTGSDMLHHMNSHIGNDNSRAFSCLLRKNLSKLVWNFEDQNIKSIIFALQTQMQKKGLSESEFYFVCNMCKDKFDSVDNLKTHWQKSLLEVIECKHCRSYFLDSLSWERHRTLEHPKAPRFYRINKKLLCADLKRTPDPAKNFDNSAVLSNQPVESQKKQVDPNVVQSSISQHITPQATDNREMPSAQSDNSSPETDISLQTCEPHQNLETQPCLCESANEMNQLNESGQSRINELLKKGIEQQPIIETPCNAIDQSSLGGSSETESAQSVNSKELERSQNLIMDAESHKSDVASKNDTASGVQDLEDTTASDRAKDIDKDRFQESQKSTADHPFERDISKKQSVSEIIVNQSVSVSNSMNEAADVQTSSTNDKMQHQLCCNICQFVTVCVSTFHEHILQTKHRTLISDSAVGNEIGCSKCSFKANDASVLASHILDVHDNHGGQKESNENNVEPDGTSTLPRISELASKQMIRLFDALGMEEMDACLKPLYNTLPNGKLVCSHCNKRFNTVKRIHQHIFFCLGKMGVVMCPYCLHQEETGKLLVEHNQEMHKDKDKKTIIYRHVNITELLEAFKSSIVTHENFQRLCVPFNTTAFPLEKTAAGVSDHCKTTKDAELCTDNQNEQTAVETNNQVTANISKEKAAIRSTIVPTTSAEIIPDKQKEGVNTNKAEASEMIPMETDGSLPDEQMEITAFQCDTAISKTASKANDSEINTTQALLHLDKQKENLNSFRNPNLVVKIASSDEKLSSRPITDNTKRKCDDKSTSTKKKVKLDAESSDDKPVRTNEKRKLDVESDDDKSVGAKKNGKLDTESSDDKSLGANKKRKLNAEYGDDNSFDANKKRKLDAESNDDKSVGANEKRKLDAESGDDKSVDAKRKEKLDAKSGDDKSVDAKRKEKLDAKSGDDKSVERKLDAESGDDKSVDAKRKEKLDAESSDDKSVGAKTKENLDAEFGDDKSVGTNEKRKLDAESDDDKSVGAKKKEKLDAESGDDKCVGAKTIEKLDAEFGDDKSVGTIEKKLDSQSKKESPAVFCCSVCPKFTSYSYTEMKKHMKTSHSEKSAKIKRIHKDRTHGKFQEESMYECSYSSCKFICNWNEQTMRNHVKDNHTLYRCGYCPAQYYIMNHLNNHIRFLHRGKEKKFEVDELPLEHLFHEIQVLGLQETEETSFQGPENKNGSCKFQKSQSCGKESSKSVNELKVDDRLGKKDLSTSSASEKDSLNSKNEKPKEDIKLTSDRSQSHSKIQDDNVVSSEEILTQKSSVSNKEATSNKTLSHLKSLEMQTKNPTVSVNQTEVQVDATHHGLGQSSANAPSTAKAGVKEKKVENKNNTSKTSDHSVNPDSKEASGDLRVKEKSSMKPNKKLPSSEESRISQSIPDLEQSSANADATMRTHVQEYKVENKNKTSKASDSLIKPNSNGAHGDSVKEKSSVLPSNKLSHKEESIISQSIHDTKMPLNNSDRNTQDEQFMISKRKSVDSQYDADKKFCSQEQNSIKQLSHKKHAPKPVPKERKHKMDNKSLQKAIAVSDTPKDSANYLENDMTCKKVKTVQPVFDKEGTIRKAPLVSDSVMVDSAFKETGKDSSETIKQSIQEPLKNISRQSTGILDTSEVKEVKKIKSVVRTEDLLHKNMQKDQLGKHILKGELKTTKPKEMSKEVANMPVEEKKGMVKIGDKSVNPRTAESYKNQKDDSFSKNDDQNMKTQLEVIASASLAQYSIKRKNVASKSTAKNITKRKSIDVDDIGKTSYSTFEACTVRRNVASKSTAKSTIKVIDVDIGKTSNSTFEASTVRRNVASKSTAKNSKSTGAPNSEQKQSDSTTKAFTCFDHLKEKKGMSIEDYPYKCTACKVDMKSVRDIDDHFRWLHRNDSVQFVERRSGSIFSCDGKLLGGKQDLELPDDRYRYLCRYCPFRRDDRSSVETHEKNSHPGSDVHVIYLHTQDEAPLIPLIRTGAQVMAPFQPDLTEAQFPPASADSASRFVSDNPNISSAARSMSQAPPVRFRCPVCDESLSTEFWFRLHLARHPGFTHVTIHTRTNGLLWCSICGYVATSNQDLASHTGQHLDERRYSCSLCDADSHTKKGLDKHFRIVHLGNNDAYVVDRQELRKGDLRPKLVNLDVQVKLNNCLQMHPKDLVNMLKVNDIKFLDVPSDMCSGILESNNDEYFAVRSVDQSRIQ